jgi:hypothetical protein
MRLSSATRELSASPTVYSSHEAAPLGSHTNSAHLAQLSSLSPRIGGRSAHLLLIFDSPPYGGYSCRSLGASMTDTAGDCEIGVHDK